MEEQIAQLGLDRLGVGLGDGVVEFQRFLDQVWSKRFWCLRGVPGTPRTQVAHQLHNASKRRWFLHLHTRAGTIRVRL